MARMIYRRMVLASAAAAAIAVVGGGVLFPRPTPPFVDGAGKVLPGSVAEETYLQMREAKEYLLLRGRNGKAPVILFVHGGPGGSETPLMRLFDSPLEDQFVMAYWDQRGAGKSYSPLIPTHTMTIAQFLDDMDVVVDHLRKRLGKERVWVLGHSWGSALGMLYARRHPQKVAGYIGVGQIASNPKVEMHAYEFVLEEARKRQDRDALTQVAAIGPPPYVYDQLVIRDRLLDRYGGYFHIPLLKWEAGWRAFWTSEVTFQDVFRIGPALAFSQRTLWPAFARLDLTREAPSLDVPVTFILGRYDQRAWAPLAAAYLDQLRAPEKRLVWLENSAHNGPFEEPAAFQAAVAAAVTASR